MVVLHLNTRQLTMKLVIFHNFSIYIELLREIRRYYQVRGTWLV